MIIDYTILYFRFSHTSTYEVVFGVTQTLKRANLFNMPLIFIILTLHYTQKTIKLITDYSDNFCGLKNFLVTATIIFQGYERRCTTDKEYKSIRSLVYNFEQIDDNPGKTTQ